MAHKTTEQLAHEAATEVEETMEHAEAAVEEVIPQARGAEGGSPILLGAALGSIALALFLYARKKKEDAVFVGLWAPTFLGLGLFKDLLKLSRKPR